MITFVRHGESLFNKQQINQGRMDNPLTELGLRQAKIVAERLKNAKFDIIYTSPLTRTLLTAQEINKFHNVEIITDKRILEVDKGTLTGKPRTPKTIMEFKANPRKFNGETKTDIYNRVIDFFKEIENDERDILIVSHNGVFGAIYSYLNNLQIEADTPLLANCGIYICEKGNLDFEMAMRLNKEPFEKIKSGTKTIEMRLYDEKRKEIVVGEIIHFINRQNDEELTAKVVALHIYPSFKELYKNFDKLKLGYNSDEEANFKDMEKYYSPEEQEKYGVVGIEIELI